MLGVFRFSKRITGFILVTFPGILALLIFFLKIDTFEDLANIYPGISGVVEVISTYFWMILLVLSALYIFSSFMLYLAKFGKPVTTGGYLREYESEHLISYSTVRRTPEKERRMYNQSSAYFDAIRKCAVDMCDRIADLLKFNFNKEFSVCIKLIDVPGSRVTRSADQVYLHTFCRGGKDKISRSETDAEKVPLSGNSDFLSIFEGAPYFSSGNLRAYALIKRLQFWDNHLYQNSSRNYIKNYLSTIVVPIKLNNRYVSNSYYTMDHHKNQLFGFLCIDCKSRCPPHVVKKIVPYMQAFADSMYIFFDEILSSEVKNQESKQFDISV